jgi:NAD(P)-dependent dehydrogenase (short-subunit alcohol dehydrogenase family)
MQLASLKVIVTGAARGMGAHFARRLAEAGARVAAGDVDDAGLAALPDGIERLRRIRGVGGRSAGRAQRFDQQRRNLA